MFASIIIGENPPPPPLNSLDTKYLIWDQKELEKLFLHAYVLSYITLNKGEIWNDM